MSITLEFVQKCAGREAGNVEVVYDETLAREWIDSGAAKEVREDRIRPHEDRALMPPKRK